MSYHLGFFNNTRYCTS